VSKDTTSALRGYISAVLVLTAIAIMVVAFRGYVQHLPYPFNHLLFFPWERFSDLTHYVGKCAAFASGAPFRGGDQPTWIYPAPAAYLTCDLLNHTAAPIVLLSLVSLFICAFATLTLWRAAKAYGNQLALAGAAISVTLLTSYPLAYGLDRANLETLMMGFVFLFIVFFAKENYWLAAAALVCAACIKPYPAFFAVLLLFRHRYRETAVAAAAFLALNYAALIGFGTSAGESFRGIQAGWKYFVENRVVTITPSEIGFDHSLFSVVKRAVQILFHPALDGFGAYYQPYLLVMAVAGLALLWRIRKMPVLNQFFALTLVTVYWPFVAYDYNLLELYLPWGLFVLFLLQEKAPPITARAALWILIPCAIAFTPQSFLLGPWSGFGGQIKAIALTAMLFAVLKNPLPAALFGERRVCSQEEMPLPVHIAEEVAY
jgi:hypothetical protein